jgi:uncharacterized membrane protein
MTAEQKAIVYMVHAHFPNHEAAQKGLDAIRDAAGHHQLKMLDAAILLHDADGKTHVRDIQDMSGRTGALVGAIEGGLIGLLAGPIGAVAGAAAGAITGGVSASMFEFGMPRETLEKIARETGKGRGAVIVLVEDTWLHEVRHVLEPLADSVHNTRFDQ